MQAIVTRYIGPTNLRVARIKANAAGTYRYMSYDHRYDRETNHLLAAQMLAEQLGWSGRWFSGALPDNRDYAHVCTPMDNNTGMSFTVPARRRAEADQANGHE